MTTINCNNSLIDYQLGSITGIFWRALGKLSFYRHAGNQMTEYLSISNMFNAQGASVSELQTTTTGKSQFKSP